MKTNYNFKVVEVIENKFSETIISEGSNWVYEEEENDPTELKSEFIKFLKQHHPGYTAYSATMVGKPIYCLIGILIK